MSLLRLLIKGEPSMNAAGSYVGTVGMPRFMLYVVDGDNNGQINLSNTPTDTLLGLAFGA